MPARHFVLWIFALAGCSATSLEPRPADLGQATTWQAMMAVIDAPGPIVLDKHLAAHWSVALSGLVNLDHPLAREAGLEDRAEPIEIYSYRLRHPRFGNFLVDSGISEDWRNPDGPADVAWIVRKAMDTGTLTVEQTTAELMAQAGQPLNGVLLTHIHLDHIMGLADVPASVPVYLGPGDAAISNLTNLVLQGTTDRLLGGTRTLQEWRYDGEEIIDVFGDGSLFALHVPGHTPGSTAYLARTTQGPQLMTGDACHTAWGWLHGVEPGTFSEDQPRSVPSLERLRSLASAHPAVIVHPGHQSLLRRNCNGCASPSDSEPAGR